MSAATGAAAQLAVSLLYRAQASLAGAASVSCPKVRLAGLRRVVGNFHLAAGMAPAAGYPRVRQSADGVNWDLVTVIPQDGGQADVQFPFDLTLQLPYVAVELVNGGVVGNCSANAMALPY